MNDLLLVFLLVVGALLALAGALHLLPRLGGPGRRVAAMATRAPLLDLVVFLFTVAPPIAGLAHGVVRIGTTGGALGALGVAVLGQLAALVVWTIAHEAAHPKARRGARIITTLNRKVGAVRNLTAVFWTAWAVPVFAVVRAAEIFVYPPLTWLVRLPRYRGAEWVNVSRQKYDGLIGHDLIWCLYCDWMTGVWSLGSEMLRNVESFWCPIRFASPEKCANCRVDFPDVEGGWVDARGTMADVVRVLDEKYPGPGANQWFGHPARLTVEGRETGRREEGAPAAPE